ncbi:OLC1v1001625C1 [Oldenlandia corymbosa var. corymbosa]|uniref:OLC1v1001625C1 n=1 Tax=Oldenlandia corymbosa var. corymbosa TaxID=529605 RepID=A0AAV1D880_OLDCO|nr:OLC1v1001625C1 [Oldenlandia corymbosa var. corymbosa]
MPPGHNQNRNQNQAPDGDQRLMTVEDFNLRETSPSLGGGRVVGSNKVGTAYDLVEQMNYLYVRVIKARELPTRDGNDRPDPFVEVTVGSINGMSKHLNDVSNPEWKHVFAILGDQIQSPVMEVAVRDKSRNGDNLIGLVTFDVIEVPRRVPPDSPLAPEWYTLEKRNGIRTGGEIMLAVWKGTQADEAFPEACHLDAGTAVSNDGVANFRSKVYLSPRLWYLRVNVIEAQDLQLSDKNRQHPEFFAKVALGNVILRTKITQSRNMCPLWNEDLMFVASEPFEEQLNLSIEEKVGPNKEEVLGKCVIPLNEMERRLDFRTPTSRWYGLEKNASDNGQTKLVKLNSRVRLRLSLDGGYHVLDELTQYSSDFKPTAKQLWKPAIGILELGILSAQGLSPVKTKDGRGMTDAYCVAKYGQKWIRTRTILNNFNPKWNEQYTWEVFDPCTVITIGVFDNSYLQGDKPGEAKDSRIGKVRIRLSTLETERVYTHSYPLILLSSSGVKKMGEIQLAVRFSCTSLLNMLQMYNQPLLPRLHYMHPLTCFQMDNLRYQATQLISKRLSRAEPPLRKEAVDYMVDVGSNMWSMRRSKANHYRAVFVISGVIACCRWFNAICTWQSPSMTILVHILLLCFVSYPRIMLSSLFLSLFFLGIGKYRGRPRQPPHMDIRLSHADKVFPDELDEEFDTFPTSKQGDILKLRYDRLRCIGSRLQTVIGDLATQGERFYSLLSWRDPRATFLFLIFCLVSAIVVFAVPFKVLFTVLGFYLMRHPSFRERLPASPTNFFRRLPARSDSLL